MLLEVSMGFMFFLLGGILFVPIYFGALDCRLKESGVFRPLQFFRNFKYVKRGRFVCIFGFSLIIVSVVFLTLVERLEGFGLGDYLKVGAAIFLIFLIFLYGYYKSILLGSGKVLKEPGMVFGNIFLNALFNAFRDMFFLFLIAFLFLVVKLIK